MCALGLFLGIATTGCGPQDAGTISVSSGGDKNKMIEPDFGTAPAPAAERPVDSPKSVKQKGG